MDRYAVIGNPIAHSKSPSIHAAFARQTGEVLEYAACLAPLDGFVASVLAFRSEGGRGMNVTVPFKLEAFALANRHSPRAKAAGAVNTLAFRGDEIFGDNTDGAGLVRDLTHNLGVGLRGQRVLLLGAGGAARGVILPLMAEGPAALTIANRGVDKARGLCEQFEPAAGETRLAAAALADLSGPGYDIIINATAASLANEAPAVPTEVYSNCALAYDMMYARGETAFMRAARAGGARRCADGLGMLVEQAAESFLLWRGIRPRTTEILAELRRQMSSG
ncbi:MAG: shikimate dehydrogenase [Zoogloeaceae bacterium]|nr:shikimate dehydrogenase [Zoogloeaceae bacterium]